MKIYYAHCMAIYDTLQESEDVELLELMGFEVDNPNSEYHKKKISTIYSPRRKMDYFIDVVKVSDGLAFRGLPDQSLPAGVAKEIETMREKGGPVIELPNLKERKTLSVYETAEYTRMVRSQRVVNKNTFAKIF